MEKLDPGEAVPITHVKCRQCGEDMPSKANRCLHCGQVTKRFRARQVLLVVGSLILLVLLGVAFFVSLPNYPWWN
jgi:ribosomal protein L40E